MTARMGSAAAIRRGFAALAVLAMLWALVAGPTWAAPSAASWHRLANDPFGALSLPAATVGSDQRIYIIARQQFQRLEPRTQGWDTIAPQTVGYHAGLVAIGERLYAVGGWQLPSVPASLNEAYSLRTGQWHYIAESNCAHAGSGVALGRDGRIYVGGGEGGTIGTCLEAYDPHHDRWTKLPYIPRPVDEPGVAAGPDGRIYFIGGRTDHLINAALKEYGGPPVILHDVQVYDPSSNRWTTAAPMPTARVAPAAVTGPDGKIYVIGGSLDPFLNGYYVHARTLRTVEVYDPKTNHWSSGPSLGVARAAPAAVVTFDGTLYAIGGFGDNLKPLPVVEALAIAPGGPQ